MTKTQHMMILSGLGAAAMIGGALVASSHHESLTNLSRIPFVLVASGLALLLGAGGLIRRDGLAAHTTGSEVLDIERDDERNRMIAAQGKARGFDFANVALPGAIIALGLLHGSLDAIIVLFVVYAAILAVALSARARISREI